MKLLTTEQQVELQELFTKLQAGLENAGHGFTTEVVAQVNYWKGELKAKRVRRLPKESA